MLTQPKKRPKISFKDERNLTEQHHGESVKIKNILHTYQTTGVIQHTSARTPTYQNTVGMPEYYEAQLIIANANSAFEKVPAQIRAEFENDPAKYLAFIQDPENRDQIIELGLDASHIPEDYETKEDKAKAKQEEKTAQAVKEALKAAKSED